MTAAIEVRGVSKRFRLSHERYQSLKERLVHIGRNRSSEDFWALRDINLTVEQGQTFGLVGHNGSGKSTLLKLVGGILDPTFGEIATTGRVAALLELGAGFHPELTGRENVYLNASILGLTRREIDRRFDDIVAFAELEQFIDMQVRNYSSGMYVRLGFAVAVNVDPDVLLVDEVLAVGDEAFQMKCLERVKLFQQEGRTIVVVSHSVDLVRQVCEVAVVLDHGSMVFEGSAGEAVRVFREHLLRGLPYEVIDPDAFVDHRGPADTLGPQVKITSVVFEHPGAPDRPFMLTGEPLTIRVGYAASQAVTDAEFCVTVYDAEGRVLYAADSTSLGSEIGEITGLGEVALSFARMPLLDGRYPVSLGIRGHGAVYDWQEQQHAFEVMNPGPVLGFVELPLSIEVRRESGAERATG